MIMLFAVLVLVGASVNAQTITTETFGSGPNQFSIEFVEIGNPGNEPATYWYGSAGSVPYSFKLGKYEISREMINKANGGANLGITMTDMTSYGGNGPYQPASGISWFEAAKFVNYLNSTRNFQVAYKFDENGEFQPWSNGEYYGSNKFRHRDTKFVLPTFDEWHKGAFGSPNGAWYSHSTAGNDPPTPVANGTQQGTAVFGQTATTGPAQVFSAGGLSAFGTMAQAGNMAEWHETAFDGINDLNEENRSLSAGPWITRSDSAHGFAADRLDGGHPSGEDYFLGFRVAMIPEPSSLSLLLAGGAVFAAARRRKLD